MMDKKGEEKEFGAKDEEGNNSESKKSDKKDKKKDKKKKKKKSKKSDGSSDSSGSHSDDQEAVVNEHHIEINGEFGQG